MENKEKSKNNSFKKNTIRFLQLLFGLFLFAIAFNFFLLPNDLVFGGVSGLSIVFKEIFDPSMFVFIVSALLLIISLIFLGKEKTMGSVLGSLLLPLFYKLTEILTVYISFDDTEIFLATIFGGVLAGLGRGIVYKAGFTTGGTDIINQIISKYAHVSIGKAMLMSDGLIVLSSGFFLGAEGQFFAFENVMYAIIVLYVISLMADKVILGINQTKCFYIVTDEETQIKDFLIKYLEHGVTLLDGKGGYTGNKQKVIMCIVPTKEYFMVKEAIYKIDPDAFFVVTDAYESSGGQ